MKKILSLSKIKVKFAKNCCLNKLKIFDTILNVITDLRLHHLQIRHSISKMTPNKKVTDDKENENSDDEDFNLTQAKKYRSDITSKRAKFDKNCADFIINVMTGINEHVR